MVSENINIRIKFEKTGKLQFISHLDLCRTMKTAFVRAEIPIWYSKGFNPRPKMVFAMPLSIGAESLCEYVDIKITRSMPHESILKRLNSVIASELNVIDVYTPQMKFGEIAWVEYIIKFDFSCLTGAGDMFSSPIIVMKHTKSGDREIDIVPLIKRYGITSDSIRVLLCADGDRYLNPEYIASAVSKRFNSPDYRIIRINFYTNDGVTVFK